MRLISNSLCAVAPEVPRKCVQGLVKEKSGVLRERRFFIFALLEAGLVFACS